MSNNDVIMSVSDFGVFAIVSVKHWIGQEMFLSRWEEKNLLRNLRRIDQKQVEVLYSVIEHGIHTWRGHVLRNDAYDGWMELKESIESEIERRKELQ